MGDGLPSSPQPEPPRSNRRSSERKETAFLLFSQGQSIEHVAMAVGRAQTTTSEYLGEYITANRPERIDAWVDEPTYSRVAAAAATSEDGRLKPIFERLNGEVPYDKIRLVVAHLQALASPRDPHSPAGLFPQDEGSHALSPEEQRNAGRTPIGD
jgi:ATP-dependent DNA helicase RecQ